MMPSAGGTSLAATLHPSARGNGCIAYDPSAFPPTYGYDPNLAAGITFTVLFFLSMVGHVYESFRCRNWWYSFFALGAFGMYMSGVAIAILILSPCFFSAAIYYILGALINKHGRQFSPMSPKWYLIIFITLDFISICVQALGGGLAASASATYPPGDTKPGTRIMTAGIVVQLVSMAIFGFLWLLFLWRARAKIVSERVLVLATSFSSLLIVVRNLYRVLELSQGWEGELITHEVYFAVLDEALMVLAVGVFNLVFPGRYLLGEEEARRQRSMTPRKGSEYLEPRTAVRGWEMNGSAA
ncbi:MAG: hypothetical protein Q9171_006908 [Xanthocarpia ochracea]